MALATTPLFRVTKCRKLMYFVYGSYVCVCVIKLNMLLTFLLFSEGSKFVDGVDVLIRGSIDDK